MPGLIAVSEFVEETREDYNSPTTSTFVSRMPQCRQTITSLEEVSTIHTVTLSCHKHWTKLTEASPNLASFALVFFFLHQMRSVSSQLSNYRDDFDIPKFPLPLPCIFPNLSHSNLQSTRHPSLARRTQSRSGLCCLPLRAPFFSSHRHTRCPACRIIHPALRLYVSVNHTGSQSVVARLFLAAWACISRTVAAAL